MEKEKGRTNNIIINGIINIVNNLKITEDDFKAAIGGFKRAHTKVTDEILSEWRKTNGFGKAKAAYAPRGGTYGIDVLGRDFERGRILVAVEVDTWPTPIQSWMKLSDIRAENKIWIYITNDKRAKERFQEAEREIRYLLSSRHEDANTFGNFILIMKTPKEFEVKKIF